MKSKGFPGCCTARVLYDLGGTSTAAHRKDHWPEEKLWTWLLEKVGRYKGTSCLVVITNSAQKQANAMLKELDFEHSDWMKKEQHAETKIRLWWKAP